jgi:hypothetical protein
VVKVVIVITVGSGVMEMLSKYVGTIATRIPTKVEFLVISLGKLEK